MASAQEHAKTVLSGILPNRRDLLEKALRSVGPDHFEERVDRKLFEFLEHYSGRTGGVLPRKFLDDLLRGAETGIAQLYLETYDLYADHHVEDSDFIWSLDMLREIAAEKATGEVLTDSFAILRDGKQLQSGEVLKGHEDARAFLLESFSAIDRDLTLQEAPEGDVREESRDFMEDYLEREVAHEEGRNLGIQTGIQDLDEKIGGLQNGEVVLVAGYAADGKSSLCAQVAWHASVKQGKNVVFFTTETHRDTMRRKIVARHSTEKQFGLSDGLNTRDLKNGTLTVAQRGTLKEVLRDLSTNEDYGILYIIQVPRAATIASLEQRLNRLQRKFNVDLVVMDYLALLASSRTRGSNREELVEIMKDTKRMVTTFDNGRGVPIISPWQVTREARVNAEKIGMYSSASLAETAEATNTTDIILSILAPVDNSERRTEVTMQILKNRDGESANGLVVRVDYATCTFEGRGRVAFGGTLNASDATFGGYLD